MHAYSNLTVLKVHTQIHPHGPQTKQWAWLRTLWLAGLTGAQPGWQVAGSSAEAQPSLRVSGFLSLAPLQMKESES